MQYSASTLISAPVERVWNIITDGERYPEWEPNVTRFEGRIEPGGAISLHTTLSPRAFALRVTEFRELHSMAWTGGMPLGLFRGVRTFTLKAEPQGVRLEVKEVFSGPLLGLMRKVMPDLSESFEQYVQAVKDRAESEIALTARR